MLSHECFVLRLTDNNRNGVYDAAADALIKNTRIVLLYGAIKKRAVGDVLASSRTNAKGEFQIRFDKQQAGINLEITKDNERNSPLLQFKTDFSGGANIDVPVLRPTDSFTAGPAALTPVSAAQVNGTGKPGFRVFLYSDGIFVGETTIRTDGTYTVTSSKPLSTGSHKITATMVDDKGAETVPIDCGTLTVVGTPLIPDPAVLTSENKAKVTGSATPGAVIKIYAAGVYAGQTVCGSDGKFSVTSTSALSARTHEITVSQTPTGGAESAQVDCGSLTVGVIEREDYLWLRRILTLSPSAFHGHVCYTQGGQQGRGQGNGNSICHNQALRQWSARGDCNCFSRRHLYRRDICRTRKRDSRDDS